MDKDLKPHEILNLIDEVTKDDQFTSRTFEKENKGIKYILPVSALGDNDSGWHIKGDIIEDYYEWVEGFMATHPEYGKVWGDFNGRVYAWKPNALERFLEDHPYEEFNLDEI